MINMFRKFSIVIIGLFLLATGCATSSTLLVVDYSSIGREFTNLPVNLIISLDEVPADGLVRWNYEERIFIQNAFFDKFLKEKFFSRISTYNGKYPYTISVKYHAIYKGDATVDVPLAFLNALTLFLVPISETVEHVAEFEVFKKNDSIALYSYSDVRKSAFHTRIGQEEENIKAIDNLIENFLTDIDRDGLLKIKPKENRIQV